MKINDKDFEKYFETYSDEFKNEMELYLNNRDLCNLSKQDIIIRITELYYVMGKKLPFISWHTLTEIKNEFYENIEIITTLGNINWVYFHDTFLNFLSYEVNDANPIMYDIYAKYAQFNLLYDVMFNIFGFIELEDELILIEKPGKIYELDENLEFHSITGPAIQIGDFKEYFIEGVNVTRIEWSKRLRIALIDSTDDLIDKIDMNMLNKIRNEVFSIEGNSVKNINEPKVIVFYLDREMLNNTSIRNHFSTSVDKVFEQRHFNALAFFIPTDGEEKIECINPKLISNDEYKKVIEVLETCKAHFDIGTTE